MTHRDEHECFSRGCTEMVAGVYYCARHTAILERQRAAQSKRNSERAADTRWAKEIERLRRLGADQDWLDRVAKPAEGGA